MDADQWLRLLDITVWPVTVSGLTSVVVWKFGASIRSVIRNRHWEVRAGGVAFIAGDPIKADSAAIGELAGRGGETGHLARQLNEAIEKTQRLWDELGSKDRDSRVVRIVERAKQAIDDNPKVVRPTGGLALGDVMMLSVRVVFVDGDKASASIPVSKPGDVGLALVRVLQGKRLVERLCRLV